MYEVYQNQESGTKDENGFITINNWKIIPAFAGLFLVRMDYFEKFYSIYQTESKSNKEFPCGVARLLLRKERSAPDERMIYIKTQECWDQDLQKEILRKQETERYLWMRQGRLFMRVEKECIGVMVTNMKHGGNEYGN